MELKPHGKLTRTLQILLKITIVVTAIAIAVGFYDLYSYSTLPSGVEANDNMLSSDVVNGIVGIIQIVLAIVTGITFLRWIYRSNKNLHALSGESMTFTPGWSVGWYFIPIANLWKPYQVMKEIWNVSHKDSPTNHTIVCWWWTLWLISNFLGRLAFKLGMRADDANSYAVSATMFIISDGLDMILTVVTLVMVTHIGTAYSRNIVEPTGPVDGGSVVASPPPLT